MNTGIWWSKVCSSLKIVCLITFMVFTSPFRCEAQANNIEYIGIVPCGDHGETVKIYICHGFANQVLTFEKGVSRYIYQEGGYLVLLSRNANTCNVALMATPQTEAFVNLLTNALRSLPYIESGRIQPVGEIQCVNPCKIYAEGQKVRSAPTLALVFTEKFGPDAHSQQTLGVLDRDRCLLFVNLLVRAGQEFQRLRW